jgi:hypothetical protein
LANCDFIFIIFNQFLIKFWSIFNSIWSFVVIVFGTLRVHRKHSQSVNNFWQKSRIFYLRPFWTNFW